jgi:hypothetical protein
MQFGNGARGDGPYGSTPAGMHCGYGSIPGIDNQERNAIRGFDGYQNVWRVFDKGVAFSQTAGPAFGGDHLIGMDLVESGDIWARAEII